MDRINWVTRDCLHAIGRLAEPDAAHASAPAQVLARMRTLVRGVKHRAREAGYDSESVDLILYAVIALADEVVMSGSGPLREAWSIKPLQLVYFGDALAGENFYANLARAREARNLDVVRVYYLCLLLGFRGRYAASEREAERTVLLEHTRAELKAALPLPDLLAPDVTSHAEARLTRGASSFPMLVLSPLLLALVLYLGLTVSLRERVAALTGSGRTAEGRP